MDIDVFCLHVLNLNPVVRVYTNTDLDTAEIIVSVLSSNSGFTLISGFSYQSMRFLANCVLFPLNQYSTTLSAVFKCPNLCTASYLWVLISLWPVILSHPSESSRTSLACSRGAAEWSGLWLCGSFPPTWVTGLDAGCCHFSGCLQIRLQEWKHPSLFPLPSQSRGLQQQRRRPFQPSDHHLLSRGRCVQL